MDKLNSFCFLSSRNFGDAVNNRFFTLLSGKKIQSLSVGSGKPHFLGTGSIFKLCNTKSIIVGTGFISENDDVGRGNWSKPYTNKVYRKPQQIISVRGPKTREKLIKMGLDCPTNYGDPLILFPLVYEKFTTNNGGRVGIIPHYVDKGSSNVNILTNAIKGKGHDVIHINILVGSNFENFINNINRCDTIISSSLHGVILGLVYGKKTIFTEFSNKVVGNKFKFYDFFESLKIKYDIPNYNDANILDKYIRFDKKNLLEIGLNMINVYPFISSERKAILSEKWRKIVNNNY